MTETKANYNWGGKRKGAGAKKNPNKQKTKIIRVPENYPDRWQILETIETLKDWKAQSEEEGREKSPRWEKVKELLKELEFLTEIDT